MNTRPSSLVRMALLALAALSSSGAYSAAPFGAGDNFTYYGPFAPSFDTPFPISSFTLRGSQASSFGAGDPFLIEVFDDSDLTVLLYRGVETVLFAPPLPGNPPTLSGPAASFALFSALGGDDTSYGVRITNLAAPVELTSVDISIWRNGTLYQATFSDGLQSFITAVPEPEQWALMVAGLAMIGRRLARANAKQHDGAQYA